MIPHLLLLYTFGSVFFLCPTLPIRHENWYREEKGGEMKKLLLLGLMACLAGCVIGGPYPCGEYRCGYWKPPYGMSKEIAARETYNCQYMANMQAKWTKNSWSVADDQFRQCMHSRGFTYVYGGQPYSQNSYSYTPNETKLSSQTNYDVPGEVESVGVPQKYIYGVVDVKRLIGESSYLKKYYLLRKSRVGRSRAEGETLTEIKRLADYFCKTRNYNYLAIGGADTSNLETGYICPPEKSISPMYSNLHNVGDATFYLGFYIDREFDQGRI